MVRLFKKRFKGVAILEATMTLPIILSILFFSLELIRIELAQIAADAIAKRCTLELMDSDQTKKERMEKFDKIISDLRPAGIPLKNIRFYIRLYPKLHKDPGDIMEGMMDVPPYGGETIGWADSAESPSNKSPNEAAKDNYYGLSSTHPLMRGYYNTAICNGSEYGEVGDTARVQYLTDDEDEIEPDEKQFDIKGFAFVFTVAIKFPFSSSFVSQFFGNGSNTNKKGVYIIWARGSGIVNKTS